MNDTRRQSPGPGEPVRTIPTSPSARIAPDGVEYGRETPPVFARDVHAFQ